jgi:hypothetical protein
MKKKIFTLLASALMLFGAAFASYGQPWLGTSVPNLPDGDGVDKKAYHLRVTHLGTTPLTEGDNTTDKYNPKAGLFLAMDSLGRLVLRDGDHFINPNNGRKLSPLERLYETLWCIDRRAITDAQGAQFTFLNKYYGTDLSVDIGGVGEEKKWQSAAPSVTVGGVTSPDSVRVYKYYDKGEKTDTAVWLGGQYNSWLTGSTYFNHVEEFTLRIPLGTGWYLTLAVGDNTADNTAEKPYNDRGLYLARVHINDFTSGEFYEKHLVKFTLYETVPRVLTAAGINLLLSEGGITIDQDIYPLAPGETNPFAGLVVNTTTPAPAATMSSYGISRVANGVEAVYKTVSNSYYVRLRTGANNRYLIVKDGSIPGIAGSYYDGDGKKYPRIETVTTNSPDTLRGRADFRFVYYPSKNTVVVNVRQLRIPISDNNIGRLFTDTVTQYIENVNEWNSGGKLSDNKIKWGDFYSYDHPDLFIQTQRIESDRFVVTAGGSNGIIDELNKQFYIGNGQAGCVASDTRTSVANNLYLIKEYLPSNSTARPRYLTVPLYTGSYSPQWVAVSEDDAKKSPAFHWFVRKYDGSAASKVELTNREFSDIKFEYVQPYTDAKPFSETWVKNGQNYNFGTNLQGVSVRAPGSFVLISEAKYRKDPYLGYRNTATDGASLAAGSYTLEYYHRNAPGKHYVGLRSAFDSAFFAVPTADKALFRLTAANYANESKTYGIADADYKKYGFNSTGTDTIVPLQRQAYTLAISDYATPSRNDHVIALEDNTSYVHAAANSPKAAQFYLRYQYTETVDGLEQDYYSLLQRIRADDFGPIADRTNLKITDELHNGDDGKFGVLQVAVHPYELTISAVSRFGTSDAVSAFALATRHDPLYRRLDDEGLGIANPAPNSDKPQALKFFQARGVKNYLYEDMYSTFAYDKWGNGTSAAGTGIKFLGLGTEGSEIYVDTAYVNRAGYELKPQYLLAVDPKTDLVAFPGRCPTCSNKPVQAYRYTHARYLVNATDSFDKYRSNESAYYSTAYRYDRYIRLAFVDAIHVGDTLWFLKEQSRVNPDGTYTDPLEKYRANLETDYTSTSGEVFQSGTRYLMLDALAADNPATGYTGVIGTANERANYAKNLSVVKSQHRPYIFSLRYVDQAGEDPARPFFLENEAVNNRPDVAGSDYGPTVGGWVKVVNGYLVISRIIDGASEPITAAEQWDVESADGPTSIKELSSPSSVPEVISGVGSVTILNASGKRVVITNVLGQTILKSVLTSDRALLSAPAGVVIVSIEGEGAVKAIVK